MEPPSEKKPGQLRIIWAKPKRPARTQHPSLSREHIIQAAILLADAEGAEALAMRRIATQLGVGTMSLYWYITSKQDLFDLVLDAVLGELDLSAPLSGDWRADLRRIVGEMRSLLLRHTWVGSLLNSGPPLGPNGLRYVEYCLAAIDGRGLDGSTMVMIIETIVSYVVGSVLSKAAEEEVRRRNDMTEEEWQTALIPYLHQIVATGRYPTFARLLTDGNGPPAQEISFEFGLTCILDGIASAIAESHS